MVYTNLGTPETLQLGAAHPIHLHGHHYYVRDIGYPTYFANGTVNSSNSAINCSADNGNCSVGAVWTNGMPPPSPCEATNTCPLKDTVIVPVGGYVRIRFPGNNWGWWIMHCHIEPHFLGRMAIVVNETSAPGFSQVPDHFPKCANFDFLSPEPATQPQEPATSPQEPATSPQEPSTSPAPQEPGTPTALPIVRPEELDAYRNATIALTVISLVLLALLIAAVVVILVMCFRKGGSKTTKVEVEMK